MSQNEELQVLEDKIYSKINPGTTSAMVFSGGNLNLQNMAEAMEMAKVMSLSRVAVPKHLRGDPGACLAVVLQALEWKMSPFSVANKSYSVSDRMAYEAQMINAVILQRAPIKGRLKYTYTGEGAKRKCRVQAVLQDGETVEYESPETGSITTKNSPTWKSDPDQQLGYFSSRNLARRHFPDVLLGVYTPEEMAEAEPMERQAAGRDVTAPQSGMAAMLAGKTDPPPDPATEPIKPIKRPLPPSAVEIIKTLEDNGYSNELFLRAVKRILPIAKGAGIDGLFEAEWSQIRSRWPEVEAAMQQAINADRDSQEGAV